MIVVAGLSVMLVALLLTCTRHSKGKQQDNTNKEPVVKGIEWPWEPPDTSAIPHTESGDLIRYGKLLMEKTALFLGPEGSVQPISNGLNCQNCHLDAGTRPWGNNYGAVAANYPKFRRRSGIRETLVKKINDCFERSMNGLPLDSTSREMQAMIAYINWVGKDVPKGKQPLGTGLTEPAYLDRAADTVLGKKVYIAKCQLCHGANGQGLKDTLTGRGYIYPPLWGLHSYNTGAGIFRIGKFASFVKNNMPYGARFGNSQLTDEECWDVAAYVNSQPRTNKLFSDDWPDIGTKPVDHPFGPYNDPYPESRHKYGPFKDMKGE